jgi:hypothetical protein
LVNVFNDSPIDNGPLLNTRSNHSNSGEGHRPTGGGGHLNRSGSLVISYGDCGSGRRISCHGGGPVASWLSELAHVHESECTIMLQSKPVRRRDCELSERDNAATASGGVGNTGEVRERIRAVQERAHTVSSVFSTLCR